MKVNVVLFERDSVPKSTSVSFEPEVNIGVIVLLVAGSHVHSTNL